MRSLYVNFPSLGWLRSSWILSGTLHKTLEVWQYKLAQTISILLCQGITDNLTYIHFHAHVLVATSRVHVCVGSNKQQIHRQLCELVSGTSLGEILATVIDGAQCEELYRRYLHDFVRTVHKCPHKQDDIVRYEYQVQTRALLHVHRVKLPSRIAFLFMYIYTHSFS